MTEHEDPRTGTETSGFVQITAADGQAPQTAVDVRADALFRVTRIKIEYEDAASATTNVDLYDDADGTSAGNVSDQRDRFANIDPDMVVEAEGPWGVFENDVLVQADNNQDDVISVTVYGEELTDLKDMVGF